MINEMVEPSLDLANRVLKKDLVKQGISRFIWFNANNNLRGDAKSCIDEQKQVIITFKNDSFINNQRIISHELTHALLYTKGIPRVVVNQNYTVDVLFENSIIQLDNIFDHIIMSPLLKNINCSVEEDELPMIRKSIGELPEFITKNKEDGWIKLLLNTFFIRAKTMGVGVDELDQLKSVIQSYGLYDDSVIVIITNNLPSFNSEIKDCRELKERCIKELSLCDRIKIERYSDRDASAGEP